jgi:hypothetical protein
MHVAEKNPVTYSIILFTGPNHYSTKNECLRQTMEKSGFPSQQERAY